MRTTFLAVLFAGGLTSVLQAQSAPIAPNETRAAELIAQAQQISSLKDRLKVARLYEEVGDLLPESDPRTASALLIAANAYYFERRFDQSRVLLERSARAYAAHGATVEASNVLVQAIFLTIERKDRSSAARLIEHTLRFVSNHDLPADYRRRLLQRLAELGGAVNRPM